MAKLRSLPDSATIMACRGRVDFYFWMGIPVARSWPRKSTQPRTAGEIRSSEIFTAAAKITGNMDAKTTAAYRRTMAGVGVGVTWIDYFRATARGKSWIEFSG